MSFFNELKRRNARWVTSYPPYGNDRRVRNLLRTGQTNTEPPALGNIHTPYGDFDELL